MKLFVLIGFEKDLNQILDRKKSQIFRNTPWLRSALYQCFPVDAVFTFTLFVILIIDCKYIFNLLL